MNGLVWRRYSLVEMSRAQIFRYLHRPPTAAHVCILCFLFLSTLPTRAQQEPQLLPSEALASAMDPFIQARSQNGDLTEADKLALSLGMTHAARDCLALTAAPQPAALNPTEQLALGRLCIFGQQYEPARSVLVDYLALPSPPDREAALVLLVRAFVGLESPGSATIQVLSLFRDYPYDAQIHIAADEAISACEKTEPMMNWYIKDICKKQLDATLPLLLQGKSLAGKDESISSARIYADALRCTTLARYADDRTMDPASHQLTEIVQQENWQHTADLSAMKEALARSQMIGEAVPLPTLHARQLSATGVMTPRLVALNRDAIVIIPFTLWSPSANEMIHDLAAAAPTIRLYAVTSWSANTGGRDVASPQLLPALREMSRQLPRGIPLLIVPDTELSAFHVDQYPVGIAIRGGTVLSNVVLTDEGSIHIALHNVRSTSSVPISNPRQ